MDAVDAAVAQINTPGGLRLIATHREPFPQELRTTLLQLREVGSVDLDTLGQLDIRVGELFAFAANRARVEAGLEKTEIHAIGSHGQTMRHRPHAPHRFSLQIGSPAVIAERAELTTVADFRSRDIAAGGEGAPLVTAFHRWMFHAPSRNRAIVNIGGIANVSYLPADARQPVLGFDTGPGNILLDAWTQKHHGLPYDAEGRWAASGRYLPDLLQQLGSDTYFAESPPKSTGFEHFNLKWLEQHLQAFGSLPEPHHVQATLAVLSAQSIIRALEEHTDGPDEVYVCGGGSHNRHLMHLLRDMLGATTVDTTAALGLDPDWVEAAAFAWLAHQALEQRPGNVPSATGARHEAVLGAIYRA